MTTYRKIHGRSIQAVTTDPTESVAEGQVWYNTNSDTFKSVILTSAWSSASPMGRNPANDTLGGCGTPTAGLGFGGYSPPGGTVGLTEEYNGTGWATGGAMNTPEAAMGSFGTQTAAVSAGGSPNSAVTEEYNGTSWTTGNTMGTGRGYSASAGTETSGLVAGGNSPPILGDVEEYNGTTWSEQNNLGTSRYQFSGCGAANTAALVFGGSTPGDTGATEEYDGTNWTTGGSLNTGRRRLAGSGIQTSALAFGGNTTPPDTTKNLNEAYNGTSWTASPATLATARTALGSTRTSSNNSSAVAFAGQNASGSKFKVTEEFNSSTNTITAAAWASGGALGTARYQMGGAGDLPAGLAYGGYGTSVPGNTNKTEEYNGTSWSEQNDMANPRGQCSGQHIGTQTAALAAGGTLPGSPNYGSACEEYNGSSWTAGGALTEDSGRSYLAGFGTQTAGVAGSGYAQTGATANSEHYDGSSWTAANNMNTARYSASGTGTQTAGLAVGQYPGTGTVEEYNGTNWTSVTSYPAGRFGIYGGMGTQTDSIHAGGSASTTRTTETFGYDGTSWSTRPSLGNALSSGASGGTSTSAFIAGGRGSPPGPTAGVTTTEEFTGETTAANITDFTTS